MVKQGVCFLKDDLLFAKKALSLPLLEPLNKQRLDRLTRIAMGCLTAALHVATAHSIFAAACPVPVKSVTSSTTNVPATSKPVYNQNAAVGSSNREEEWESSAVTVVETAVEIYQGLAAFILRSPRSSRMYYDNLLCLAATVLLSGLQSLMTCTSQVRIVTVCIFCCCKSNVGRFCVR